MAEFPFDSEEEEDQLRSNPGGIPKTLPVSNVDYAKLLDRLLPFKCALVDGTRGFKRPVLEPYTPAMLRWHDNPTDGMYTAINGIVYDIAGKLTFPERRRRWFLTQSHQATTSLTPAAPTS